MPYDINSALERLEQNLKDLDSAKKQVETTVNTSDKLQQVVSNYVNSLISVQEGLGLWEKKLRGAQTGNETAFKNAIDHMSTSCTEVVDLFNLKLDETKEVFENDTNSFLIKLESENGKLSEQVKALKTLGFSFDNAIQDVNTVKVLLEGLSIDLKESQKSQDAVLDLIKDDIGKISNTTSTAVKVYVDELTRKIGDLHSNKDVKLQELAKSISAVQQVCNDIKEKSNNIELCSNDIRLNSESLLKEVLETKELNHTIINNIEKSLSLNLKKAEELQQFFKASVDGIVHQSIINRWIVVVGIAVLAALQFVLK